MPYYTSNSGVDVPIIGQVYANGFFKLPTFRTAKVQQKSLFILCFIIGDIVHYIFFNIIYVSICTTNVIKYINSWMCSLIIFYIKKENPKNVLLFNNLDQNFPLDKIYNFWLIIHKCEKNKFYCIKNFIYIF